MKVVLMALLATVAAQQLPPRDTPRTTDEGTGVIRGVVVDAHSGDPLPGASVMLSGLQAGARPAAVQTDAEGRFEFRDLPAGRYSLNADRDPYLRTVYGQRGPANPYSMPARPTLIALASGQLAEKITIEMHLGGVITGTVLDAFGYPAVGVSVQALQYRYEGGRRQLLMAMAKRSAGVTDDRGQFRLYGLPPGDYYVSANPRAFPMSPRLVSNQEGPITTYYPNTPDQGAAGRVHVKSGHETIANVALVSGRLAAVRGRAVTAVGEPFVGSINITRLEQSGTSGYGGGMVKPDGSFEVSGLAAGQYVVSVRPNNARFDADVEVARARVTVAGEDIDNLFLVGRRGATLRGRIVTDEGIPLPFTPAQLHVRVEAAPEDRDSYMNPPPVKDDYSFEVTGLHGRARIMANTMFGPESPRDETWGPKTVYWRGEDITNRYIDFDENANVDGIEIVFSRRWASVSGTVVDERGQPADAAALLIFPSDEKDWTPDSRRIRPLRTRPDGTFHVGALPGGDYLIAVTGPIEPGRWFDPEYLRWLTERATRVSVNEGEIKTVSLRFSTPQ